MKKIVLFLVCFIGFKYADAFRIEYGNNVVINRPVYEDLYIAGGTVTINAPVYGDLIIAGGTININDTVTNDIVLLGGSVIFNGFVGDDIRCAGGNIRIKKNVAGDVVLTGGTVVIERDVSIGGLLASGGNVTFNGNAMGEIKGAFGEFFLNGTVEKNIDCRAEKITVNGIVNGSSVFSARQIVIGSGAVFNNNVRYWNKKGAIDFGQSVKSGKATYDDSLRINTGEWYFLGAATILGLLWYLGMALLLIAILQYLFPSTMLKAAETVFNNSLKSLGVGFLFFIVLPIAAVISFITIIGVPVGLIIIFIFVGLVLLATVITSIVTANWFNNRSGKLWSYWRIVFSAFGIFMLVKLISLMPFVGWLFMVLAVCMAFGGIILNINWKKRA